MLNRLFTQSILQDFRLHSIDVMNLQEKLIKEEEKKGARVTPITTETPAKRSLKIEFTYHLIEKVINGVKKKMVLMPPCKDSSTKENEMQLPFVGDVINAFRDYVNNNKLDINDYELLIPMRQCRGHFHLPINFPYAKKEHIVLAIINFKDNKVTVHDSVSDYSEYLKPLQKIKSDIFYPDKLDKEIVPRLNTDGFNFRHECVFHAAQADLFACGLYLVEYLRSYLQNGHANDFDRIKIHIGFKPNNAKSRFDIYVGKEGKTAYIENFLENKPLLEEDFVVLDQEGQHQEKQRRRLSF